MDIDDILRSVSSGPDLAPETRDLQLLTRCWVAERSAPEVLPFPAELVERTMGRIRKQVCRCVPFCAPLSLRGLQFPLYDTRRQLESEEVLYIKISLI